MRSPGFAVLPGLLVALACGCATQPEEPGSATPDATARGERETAPVAGPLALVESGQELGSGNSSAVALGDLDGDGDLDAVVGNYQAADRVWLNDGAGRFSDSGLRLAPSNSSGVALGDVDGDGDLDAFVVANTWQGGDGRNSLWINTSRHDGPDAASPPREPASRPATNDRRRP